MIGLHGWAIVGTAADAPGCSLELLRDPHGQLHVGLGFLHTHPELERFLDQMEHAALLLADPVAPGIAPLVHWDRDNAGFVYPVEDGALLSTFLQVRSAMGVPAGPRAAVQLLAAVGGLLQAAGNDAAAVGLPTHGGVNPWRLVIHPSGSITLVGYALPSLEIDERQGALRFLPPERMWEEQLDLRGDIYAAGICAAELALGAPLLEGTPERVEALIVDGDVPRRVEAGRDHLPEGVVDLLLACVAPEPSGRIASARELVQRARELLPALEGPSLYDLVAPLSQAEHEGRRLLDVQRGLRILEGLQQLVARVLAVVGAPLRWLRGDGIDDERGAAIPFDTDDEAPTVAFDDPDAPAAAEGAVIVSRNLARLGAGEPEVAAAGEPQLAQAAAPEAAEAWLDEEDEDEDVEEEEEEEEDDEEEAAEDEAAEVEEAPEEDPGPALPTWRSSADAALTEATNAARTSRAWLDAALREVDDPDALPEAPAALLGALRAHVALAAEQAERATEAHAPLPDDVDVSPEPDIAELLAAAREADQANSDARRTLFRLRDALSVMEEREAQIALLIREADEHATSARQLVAEVEQTEGALAQLLAEDVTLSTTVEPSLKRLRFAATWAERAAARTVQAASRAPEVDSPEAAQAVVAEARKALEDTRAAWRRVGKEDQRARRRIPTPTAAQPRADP